MEKISRPAQRPLWTQSWATSSSHSFLFIHTLLRQPKLLVTGHTPPWVSAIWPGVVQVQRPTLVFSRQVSVTITGRRPYTAISVSRGLFSSRIWSSVSSGDRVDSLTGKALYNYNGQEMPFYRSIVFIKPDIIVLYDNIAGRLAGSIEWLWHGSGSFLVNSLEKLQGFSIVDSANRKKLRVYLFKPDSWSYSIDTGYMLEDWVSGHESTHSVLSVKESYREKHTLLAVITGNENAIAGCRNHEERQHMIVDSGNMVFDLDYSGEILECASAQAK